MFREIRIFFAVLCITFVFCHRNPSDFQNPDFIDISIPLNKTCIYAKAMYTALGDSSELIGLEIFSYRFEEKRLSGDTLFYSGEIIRFVPEDLPSSSGISPGFIGSYTANPDTAGLLLSMDREWVLFQNSDIPGAGSVFMKRDAVPDTTFRPTLSFNQFPIFPRKMKPDADYTIYRPGDTDDHFLPVERTFHTGKFARCDDSYGNSEGFSFSLDHYIPELDTMRYEGIMDEHGIVVSFCTDEILMATTEYPEGYGYYRVTWINRRIVDYSDPDILHDLSYYAELVISQGLRSQSE